jgi:hypothetical protein
MTHGVVEQYSNLARRGGDGLGLSDPRRKPPVEGPERGVGPPNGYGRKPAATLPERFVRDDSTLPPEILLFGARPSQEVKCLALGQAERLSPHSAISFSAR